MIHKAGLLVVYALLVGCGGTQKQEHPQVQSSDTLSVLEGSMTVAADTIPQYAWKVIAAYPDFDIRYSNNKLLFPDGASIVCDDGRAKSFTEKLDDCDIEDMFSMTYDVHADIPAYLSDCGRGRCEELFKKMYGSSEAMVRENLVSVAWFGQNVPFTKVNGAAEQLGKVASELANHPDLEKYLTNASSFYWRKVRGANRQSAHSYGIAIDINTAYANYWLWTNPTCSETDEIGYENRIPMEIVEIFEKYGFVWGGRWYHYDTMHFEYRPELRDCYTGFKWIANEIRISEGKQKYIGGGEESFGFLPFDKVRDKDSPASICLICEIAAWAKDNGMTLYDLLMNIYAEYGFSKEVTINVVKPGKSGADEIKQMMVDFRNNPPQQLGGSKVCLVKDYQTLEAKYADGKVEKLNMPTTANVLQWYCEDGTKISVRPSGTEPKIKFYTEIKDASFKCGGCYERCSKAAEAKIEQIKKDLNL